MSYRINYNPINQGYNYKNSLNPNFSGLTYNAPTGNQPQFTDNYATARKQYEGVEEMNADKILNDISQQKKMQADYNTMKGLGDAGSILQSTAGAFKASDVGKAALSGLKTAKESLKAAKAAGEGIETAKTAVGAAKTGVKSAILNSKNLLTGAGVGLAGVGLNIAGDKLIAGGKEGLGYASKWGGTGASVGSLFGPLGAGIGFGIGSIAGAIKGGKEKKERLEDEAELKAEADKYNTALKKNRYEAFTKARDLDRLQALQYNANQTPIFKRGGKLDTLKENVIIDGPSHDDFNNTSVKGDKGLPVIDKGAKVAEIESKELVINKKSTEQIEKLTAEYKRTKDPKIAEKLGELMQQELGENTYDYSKELL